jgi:hypothetical protein
LDRIGRCLLLSLLLRRRGLPVPRKGVGRRPPLGRVAASRLRGWEGCLRHALRLTRKEGLRRRSPGGRSRRHVGRGKPSLLALAGSPPPGAVLSGLGEHRSSGWKGELGLARVALERVLGDKLRGLHRDSDVPPVGVSPRQRSRGFGFYRSSRYGVVHPRYGGGGGGASVYPRHTI